MFGGQIGHGGISGFVRINSVGYRLQDRVDQGGDRHSLRHRLGDFSMGILRRKRAPGLCAFMRNLAFESRSWRPDRICAGCLNPLARIGDDMRVLFGVVAIKIGPMRARPVGSIDNRLVARSVALRRGALGGVRGDDLQTVGPGLLRIGAPPFCEILTARV